MHSYLQFVFVVHIPAYIFHLSLLFLFTETVNLIGDTFVVGLGVGQLQKLRLQFLQLVVNIGQGLVVSFTEDGGDVVLQGGKEGLFPAKRIIDGGDHHLLDDAFWYRTGIAEKTGIF